MPHQIKTLAEVFPQELQQAYELALLAAPGARDHPHDHVPYRDHLDICQGSPCGQPKYTKEYIPICFETSGLGKGTTLPSPDLQNLFRQRIEGPQSVPGWRNGRRSGLKHRGRKV